MKAAILVASILLFASAAFAQGIVIDQYNLTFSISEDFVRQTVQLVLQTPPDYVRFVAKTPYDIDARNSQGAVSFRIQQNGGLSTIDVFPGNDTHVEFSFSSREQIIASDDIFLFFNELAIAQDVKALHADFILPPGFVIDDYYPQEGSVLRSNGQNIILSWDLSNPTSVPLFVRYRSAQAAPFALIASAVVISLAAAAIAFYYRRRAREEFLSGLFEDEKKVVGYLMAHKTAYQNRIEKEYHFSRPKMTRLVYKLEQRGWVKKERRGRTNRLTWIRGTPDERKLARKFADRRKAQKENELASALMGETKS